VNVTDPYPRGMVAVLLRAIEAAASVASQDH
jgi:hypothetical protein